MKNRVITTLMSRAKTAKAEHQRGRASEKRGKYGAQIPKRRAIAKDRTGRFDRFGEHD